MLVKPGVRLCSRPLSVGVKRAGSQARPLGQHRCCRDPSSQVGMAVVFPSQRCCELIHSVAQEADMWEAVLVRAQQGWPASILLELLSAFGHSSLGHKEQNQIRTLPFCPCFENWDQIHFGPESPDMSSFIQPRMGPVDGRKGREAWVLVLGDLWPRLSQCAGLGEGCSHSCSRGSKPQEGQACP